MALIGTITVSTCGMNVAFGSPATTAGTANPEFRAKTLQLNNLGTGNIWVDITTTSGCSTGYQINTGTAVTWTCLGGIKGFSSIASTAGGVPVVAYLASR